jgi:thiol:disulfide interchange protein
MEAVKSIGGIALLWAALYFLRPLVGVLSMFASPELWFLGLALGAAAVGVAIGGVKLSFHGPWSERLRKGLGVVLIVAGTYSAWDWWLTPKHRLAWTYDEQAAFARAEAEGKGVIIDFAAKWCIPCAELELTFGDDDVYEAITENFVPLKFDVTDNDDPRNEAVREKWGAAALPSVIFVDARKGELARVNKMMKPDPMLKQIVRPAIQRLREGTPAKPPAVMKPR